MRLGYQAGIGKALTSLLTATQRKVHNGALVKTGKRERDRHMRQGLHMAIVNGFEIMQQKRSS